jgi:hypothetical protein
MSAWSSAWSRAWASAWGALAGSSDVAGMTLVMKKAGITSVVKTKSVVLQNKASSKGGGR